MKQLTTLTATLFLALFSFGQVKQYKIHESFGKIKVETNMNVLDCDDAKSRPSPLFQDKMNFYQNARLKSDQETKKRIDSLIIQAWDQNTSRWKIFYREEFTYDANGNMTQCIPYTDEGTGQLVAYWKSEYQHDAHGNKIQYFSSEWDESTSQWILSGKEEYTYDGKGNMTRSDGYGWEESTSQWFVTDKSEYTYDANGNMTQSVEYYRDVFSDRWVTQYKHEYAYHANGEMTQSSGYRWDESTSDWVPIDKLEYTFDAGDHIMQSLYYCWDEDASSFVECWKEEYTLDEEGNIIQNLIYTWNEGTADLMGKYEYSYDNDYARSDLILPYFEDEISIIEALDITYLFNHKMDSYLGSAWDEGNLDWISALKGDYFYSEQNVSSVNETGMEIASIYPNPCSEYLTFSFYANINQLTFELYDLQGRKLMTKPIHNNETISIEGLDNGLYVFELLTQGGNRKSGRLIKE